MINNYHILIIKFVGPTHTKDAQVKIISERFKQSKLIPFDARFGNTRETAIDRLHKNEFELIGMGEGKDHYYIITDTFKPLK